MPAGSIGGGNSSGGEKPLSSAFTREGVGTGGHKHQGAPQSLRTALRASAKLRVGPGLLSACARASAADTAHDRLRACARHRACMLARRTLLRASRYGWWGLEGRVAFYVPRTRDVTLLRFAQEVEQTARLAGITVSAESL